MFLIRLFAAVLLSGCLVKNMSALSADTKEIRPIMWTGGSFNWPCPSTKNIFKTSGRYVSKHVIATRAQIHKDDTFLVLPRFKSGVPVTLARTSLRGKGCQATLDAFPCWSMQEEGNCQALQSAVDIFLDPQVGLSFSLGASLLKSLYILYHIL